MCQLPRRHLWNINGRGVLVRVRLVLFGHLPGEHRGPELRLLQCGDLPGINRGGKLSKLRGLRRGHLPSEPGQFQLFGLLRGELFRGLGGHGVVFVRGLLSGFLPV